MFSKHDDYTIGFNEGSARARGAALATISSLRAQVAALTDEITALKSGIHPPKTPIEGGFSLDKFMPGLTPDDAATMGEALDTADARVCRHGTSANEYCPRCAADSYLKKTQPQLDYDIADAECVIAWARDPNRKPASLAFTAGPERQAAYWIEWAEARRGEARIAALTEALAKAEEALKEAESNMGWANSMIHEGVEFYTVREVLHSAQKDGLKASANICAALSLISAARQAAPGNGADTHNPKETL